MRITSGAAGSNFRLWARRVLHPARLGVLRRTRPLSSDWGFDRGTPVDRFYIEHFLRENGKDICGNVLEVKDSEYTKRYGTAVLRSDVLDIDSSNPSATLIADLARTDRLPAAAFDCFILTQTLQLVFDIRAAVESAHRLLRPEGVLLLTVPSVSKIVPDCDGDYWRFTAASCSRLFGEVFGPANITVTSYGNLLSCTAFLQGMAYQELPDKKLKHNDEAFPLIIAVRAVNRS
jgi:SAM-dependent methyltransferase